MNNLDPTSHPETPKIAVPRRECLKAVVSAIVFAVPATAEAGKKGRTVPGPTAPGPVASAPEAKVRLESPDRRLVQGFLWAKTQAMAYVFPSGPVGPSYTAGFPKRGGFNCRDVSHQSLGANVLGLAAFNKNMFRRLAASVAAPRDWCAYWTIDRDNQPSPADYRSDKDFWFCLPANFDLLQACYQQYLWTGDPDYLHDPVFLNFYDHTVTDYVRSWDKDNLGIPVSLKSYGYRGIGSYDENLQLHPLIGADLVAAEYAGYRAYSKINILLGNAIKARQYRLKADDLRAIFNRVWWDASTQSFYQFMLQDWKLSHGAPDVHWLTMWFGITDTGPKTYSEIDRPQSHAPCRVETLSYIPEIEYRYGRDDTAYLWLMQLTDPNLKRREYPEVSYAVIRTVTLGTMGVFVDAPNHTVMTRSHLTPETPWATLRNIPALDGEITVRHQGAKATTFTLQKGSAVTWRASFPVSLPSLRVDGVRTPTRSAGSLNGHPETHITVPVRPGESHTVEVA